MSYSDLCPGGALAVQLPLNWRKIGLRGNEPWPRLSAHNAWLRETDNEPEGQDPLLRVHAHRRVREHNEDAVFSDMDIGLIVLADGMGGYNAGEVAAALAIKTVTDMVRAGVERETGPRWMTAAA
jgi:hypothetical protein